MIFVPETEDKANIGSSSPLSVRVSVWLHIILASIVVGASWLLTIRIRPCARGINVRPRVRYPTPLLPEELP